MLTDKLSNYTITVYSLITGLLYLLLSIYADNSEGGMQAFIFLMVFLPGITFPIGTSYFTALDLKYSFPRVILHFILSASLYHGTVWIFSLESRYDWIVQLDGLIGSLVYLILTFVLLNVRMKIAEIVGVSILSGLAFLPFELLDHSITTCGIGVLL